MNLHARQKQRSSLKGNILISTYKKIYHDKVFSEFLGSLADYVQCAFSLNATTSVEPEAVGKENGTLPSAAQVG